MSDIPPPQSMIPPVTSPSYPELRYSDASNAYARNNVGAWVPHPGICNSQILKFVQALTSQWSFCKESGTYALGPAKCSHYRGGMWLHSSSQKAGSHRKAKAPRGKGKGKENIPLAVPKKCSREDADEDDNAQVKRGRPQGSNNYSNLDVNCLLNMVQDELPLGQRGWQIIHLKYCQWAKVNHRPP
ncbi:hypothetical protein EDB19DRAFT_1832618 [Suillus lakei]|nr:hypothetical protein EDB19DRAFT_1832618 [Suillus lakei]